MVFYFDLTWSVDLILKIIEAVCALLTLWLAYRIFKNFDLKKEFRKQQYETVIDFLKELETIEFWFHSYLGKKMKRNVRVKVSIMPRILESKHLAYFEHLKTDARVYWRFKENIISRYIANPFLPKPIVKSMQSFNETLLSGVFVEGDLNFEDIPHFLLTIGKTDEPNSDGEIYYLDSVIPALENPTVFFNEILKIKNELIKWLVAFGVRDINVKPTKFDKRTQLFEPAK